jgi:hypothetical protein
MTPEELMQQGAAPGYLPFNDHEKDTMTNQTQVEQRWDLFEEWDADERERLTVGSVASDGGLDESLFWTYPQNIAGVSALRLAASAPDLLAALEEALTELEHVRKAVTRGTGVTRYNYRPEMTAAEGKARTAIHRARGED